MSKPMGTEWLPRVRVATCPGRDALRRVLDATHFEGQGGLSAIVRRLPMGVNVRNQTPSQRERCDPRLQDLLADEGGKLGPAASS